MSAAGELPGKTVFQVSELGGADAYKLGTGLTVPRPIGWVGTVNADGVPNLAPYSFFNMVSGDPPTFLFAPTLGLRRDTLENIKATGEFTLNVVTIETAEAMNTTAASLPEGQSEFDHAGLTAVPSTMIAPPMVGEAKGNFECRVTQLVNVGRDPGANTLVIGEALVIHVASEILDGTRVDQAKLKAIGRHVANSYSTTENLFDLERPQ